MQISWMLSWGIPVDMVRSVLFYILYSPNEMLMSVSCVNVCLNRGMGHNKNKSCLVGMLPATELFLGLCMYYI